MGKIIELRLLQNSHSMIVVWVSADNAKNTVKKFLSFYLCCYKSQELSFKDNLQLPLETKMEKLNFDYKKNKI